MTADDTSKDLATKGIEVQLPLVWISPDDEEILFVNQLLIQRQGDEYILTFGQQSPPVLRGTPEEMEEQAKEMPYVPVRVAVRVGTTRARMKHFVEVMQGLLEREEPNE